MESRRRWAASGSLASSSSWADRCETSFRERLQSSSSPFRHYRNWLTVSSPFELHPRRRNRPRCYCDPFSLRIACINWSKIQRWGFQTVFSLTNIFPFLDLIDVSSLQPALDNFSHNVCNFFAFIIECSAEMVLKRLFWTIVVNQVFKYLPYYQTYVRNATHMPCNHFPARFMAVGFWQGANSRNRGSSFISYFSKVLVKVSTVKT